MIRKEKKDFTKSKKFFDVQKDRNTRLYERSVQKKTSYERDIRTMLKLVLDPLKAAENGEGEITREELNRIRLRIEKMIIRIRVLSGNKGANLSSILLKVQLEKSIILDYLQGKRPLRGLVNKKGKKPLHISGETKKTSDNGQITTEEPFDFESFDDFGFDDEPRVKTREDYFKSLGFDETEEYEEEGFEEIIEVKPVQKPVTTQNTPSTYQPTESFRRMSLNMIDDKMSQVISQGIEHLMLLRKKKGKSNVNYRDEIIKYVDNEIISKKNQTVEELRNRGYSEPQIQFFGDLYDKEFETNINVLIRKCLYLSRVLEYRKGSTSTG